MQLQSPAPLRMTGPVWSGVEKAVWGLLGIMRWLPPPCAQKPALLWLRKKCLIPTQRSLGSSGMQPRQQQGLWHQRSMPRDLSTIQHTTPPALWCPDPTQSQVQCKAFVFFFSVHFYYCVVACVFCVSFCTLVICFRSLSVDSCKAFVMSSENGSRQTES